MMLGIDKKSLGLVLQELRRLVQRNKMPRLMMTTRWRMKHTHHKENCFYTWNDQIKQQKMKTNSVKRILKHWMQRSMAIDFDTWHAVLQRKNKVGTRVFKPWFNIAIARAFRRWVEAIREESCATLVLEYCSDGHTNPWLQHLPHTLITFKSKSEREASANVVFNV